MAAWLALDLSLSSTGFALWRGGTSAPVIGHWKLADSMEYRGRAYVRLHKEIMAILGGDECHEIAFEEPLTQKALNSKTNIATLQTLTGLAAHAESFAAAIGARCVAVNVSSWRRHFIGPMARGTQSGDLKAMARQRCRELGFEIACFDESDAFGILDYRLSTVGIIPPWREGVLQEQMSPATHGRRANA